MNREQITTAVEVLGLALVIAGVWMIFVPAALIIAGVGALAASRAAHQ